MRHAIVLLLALAACHPVPQPAPIPVNGDAGMLASGAVLDAGDTAADAGDDADPAEQSCRHLIDLGCPFGQALECPEVFRLPQRFGILPSCVLDAGAPAALVQCHVLCR